MRPSLPDLALGVFATMLIRAGRPLELERHLERLRASAAALYPEAGIEHLETLAAEGARGVACGRLRLTVAPNGSGRLRTDVLAAAVDPAAVLPGWDRAVRLAGLVVEGGLGAHKWADRRLLAGAEAAGGGAVPLVVDVDDCVLEASRANLFVVEDGTIVTPPADGRILPGVTRRRVLEIAAVREEPVSLARLLAADEAFLTGSVRGVEPVYAYEHVRAWRRGEITAGVADALRSRWELDP
ncbi:MAG TPA: aminotransferase class IV [Solirubrobacteraceae bacterium]|nr:aminotransferase class IV [Solirubrobacteraceae bacterium]